MLSKFPLWDILPNGYSWGPEVTGQSYTKWDGTTANMQIFDNVKNFFDTGVNLSESISFQQQYDKTSIYTSLNVWMTPA